MKIGQMLPNYGRWFRGDGIRATCEKGKEIGLESLWLVDHVIMTPQQTIGQGNGNMDIWTALAYVAGVTNSQKWAPTLATCIAVIPFRPPIQTAKITATIDSLSGGRLLIGAGSGGLTTEFEALGLNIHERGDMSDEYLMVMKELWTHPVASFHGKYVNFDEMTISVRPVQQPIPILYGARGLRPFRRIAERYNGWVPTGPRDADLKDVQEGIRSIESDWAKINTLWEEHGREGKPYLAIAPRYVHLTTDRREAGGMVIKGISGGGREGERPYLAPFPKVHVDDLVKEIRTYADIGASEFVVHLPSYRDGEFDNQGMLLNQMDLFAEHVLPKVPRG